MFLVFSALILTLPLHLYLLLLFLLLPLPPLLFLFLFLFPPPPPLPLSSLSRCRPSMFTECCSARRRSWPRWSPRCRTAGSLSRSACAPAESPAPDCSGLWVGLTLLLSLRSRPPPYPSPSSSHKLSPTPLALTSPDLSLVICTPLITNAQFSLLYL